MGGGGNDTITYSANLGQVALPDAGTSAGYIQGGEGADRISLNGTETGGAVSLLYTNASESNSETFDTVSSNVNNSGTTDALVFSVGRIHSADTRVSAAGTINGAEVYTAIEGIVTFTSTFSDNITDQVSALDVNTNQNGGAVALFSKGTESTMYVFMQGGTAGTADDLVVKINENAASGSFGAVDIAKGNGSAFAIDMVGFGGS